MKKPQAEIYIDVHEDDSGLIDVLESRGIGNCQRLSLETGDVVIRHNGHEAFKMICATCEARYIFAVTVTE